MKDFILLTMPRSGSTWLGSLLNDHPAIDMFGELFLTHDVPDQYKTIRGHDPEKFFRFKERTHKRRPAVTFDYLEHVFSYGENACGFKVMAWPYIQHPEIAHFIKKHGKSILYLHRDIQDRVISYAVAEKRNYFHTIEHNIDNNTKISLDKKRIKSLYSKQRLLDNLLKMAIKKNLPTTLSLTYSELKDNPSETLTKVFDFLEVAPYTPESLIKKVADRPYADIVENYDEIAGLFKR